MTQQCYPDDRELIDDLAVYPERAQCAAALWLIRMKEVCDSQCEALRTFCRLVRRCGGSTGRAMLAMSNVEEALPRVADDPVVWADAAMGYIQRQH